MQSNNPVFRNSEEFNSQNAYGNSSYAGNAYGNYGQAPLDPSGRPTYAPVPSGARMTIDSVVQKTGLTVGLTILTAVVTWLMTPAIDDTGAVNQIYLVAMLGAGAAFILSLVNSFKKVISPALVLAFAVAEGVALGALS